jgi:hypothetical protein
VVYLKNGSIYRGFITEQDPSSKLKIQIAGGSVIVVNTNEVEKITKEPLFDGKLVQTAPRSFETTAKEKVKLPFEPRLKGYFFQGLIMLEAQQFGLRVVNGYKFGRFGHLGIGVGVDGVAGSPLNGRVNGLNTNDLSGVYLPLYIYYGGDILKTKITPIYAIEAGYAHPVNAYGGVNDVYYEGYYENVTADKGGAMWGLGIGVRFNTRRRINFSLLFNVNYKNVQYIRNSYVYDELSGVDYYYTEKGNATLIMGGLRFGIAF